MYGHTDKVIKWLENRCANATALNDTLRMVVDAMESTRPVETITTDDSSISRKYDIYHIRHGLNGLPTISISSLRPLDDVNNIKWKKRNDINTTQSKEDVDSVTSTGFANNEKQFDAEPFELK